MAEAIAYLRFDGVQTYIEVPSSAEFSIAPSGGLTISAWIRPETLSFTNTEGSGYVHWLGKGEKERYEWTFRMYSQDNSEGRGNRISFYVFNPGGGLGIGSTTRAETDNSEQSAALNLQKASRHPELVRKAHI